MTRWKVTLTYSNGEVVVAEIDEMIELQAIVERGPDFTLLTNIKTEYQF